MDERTLKSRMTQGGLSVLEGTLPERCECLLKTLDICFGPGSHADKVTFRRLLAWVCRECEKGSFLPEEVFPRIIDFALESTCPEARNPRAVFVSICKKELRWKP